MSDLPALRLATRASPQARTQAEAVAAALEAAGCSAELVLIETVGDQRQDVPLHTIGGQGVFVKEIQRAVLDGRADLAVHSAKDLPTIPAEGLTIGAFTARRDPADALIGRSLAELAEGATVATGSVRRRAQLAVLRPDLHFVELRGNIGKRLSLVPDDGSIVMAVAALQILGLTDRIAERLDPATFVPAPGQGCVAVEARADDTATLERLRAVDDAATRHAVEVERSFLAELGTGCSLPIGAHASNGTLHVFLAGSDAPGRPGAVATEHLALAGDDSDRELAVDAARRALATVGS